MAIRNRITVIIPTLNESKGIRKVLDRMPGEVFEVIIVDGGSTDGTIELVRPYNVKIVVERRRGYGRAYMTGVDCAEGDIIACLDGDGSYNPSLILDMVNFLESRGIDFVSGDRMNGLEMGSMPLIRNLGNRLISAFSNALFSTEIHDNQSGMWVFRRDLLERLELKEEGMPFSSEIKIEAYKKGRFAEFPIKLYEREGNRSSDVISQGYSIFKFLIKRRLSER